MILIRKSNLFLIELILICPNMILEGFSILTLHKLVPGLYLSLSEDLESLKGLLLTQFLETAVLLNFLVDISSFFARLSEDTM